MKPDSGGWLSGVRRVDSNGQMEDAGRTSVRLLVEGLVVLAVIVVGVVVVVALLEPMNQFSRPCARSSTRRIISSLEMPRDW